MVWSLIHFTYWCSHHKFEKIKYEYSLNKTNRVTCKLYPNRVAGNAAYIIGTVAETEMGCYRILGLAKGQQGERKILADLTRMLTFDDSESVMNAAGTMGTLVSDLIKENQQENRKRLSLFKWLKIIEIFFIESNYLWVYMHPHYIYHNSIFWPQYMYLYR